MVFSKYGYWFISSKNHDQVSQMWLPLNVVKFRTYSDALASLVNLINLFSKKTFIPDFLLALVN